MELRDAGVKRVRIPSGGRESLVVGARKLDASAKAAPQAMGDGTSAGSVAHEPRQWSSRTGQHLSRGFVIPHRSEVLAMYAPPMLDVPFMPLRDHEAERLDRGLKNSCEAAVRAKATAYPDGTIVQCQLPKGHELPHRTILAGMTVEWRPQRGGRR